MKPTYVSAVFRNPSVEGETVEVEGWLTIDTKSPYEAGQTTFIFITPSLDYDEENHKLGFRFKDLVSITPAQSIREFRVAGSWAEAHSQRQASIGLNNTFMRQNENGTLEEIPPDEVNAQRERVKKMLADG